MIQSDNNFNDNDSDSHRHGISPISTDSECCGRRQRTGCNAAASAGGAALARKHRIDSASTAQRVSSLAAHAAIPPRRQRTGCNAAAPAESQYRQCITAPCYRLQSRDANARGVIVACASRLDTFCAVDAESIRCSRAKAAPPAAGCASGNAHRMRHSHHGAPQSVAGYSGALSLLLCSSTAACSRLHRSRPRS
jgi:hypothetical protein